MDIAAGFQHMCGVYEEKVPRLQLFKYLEGDGLNCSFQQIHPLMIAWSEQGEEPLWIRFDAGNR